MITRREKNSAGPTSLDDSITTFHRSAAVSSAVWNDFPDEATPAAFSFSVTARSRCLCMLKDTIGTGTGSRGKSSMGWAIARRHHMEVALALHTPSGHSQEKDSVTFRRFTDRHGTDWEVWEVIPPRAERRRSERRTLPDRRMTLREGTPDRRIRARRTKASTDYVRMSPGFEHGWLCFTSGPAVRRLAPIPSDWIHVAIVVVHHFCRMELGTFNH